ncbi:Uncharacterized protein Adt_14296 [Abeliophyllum distichum]|uniref:Uncharacterized protein n=1 Tax=Abeliophyllum distichum TaxID=126358 RepID=A0ABD1TZ86_9LAMI
MEDEHEQEMSSLRSRRKKSSMCLTSCFNGSQHRRGFSLDASSSSSMPSPRRSPSIWVRSKPNDHTVTDIKGKCNNFTSRRHKRHASADFSYDPLSYALNFEEDNQAAEELPIRNFSARLPSSPSKASGMLFTPTSKTTPRSPPETCRLSRSLDLEVENMKKSTDEVANPRAAAVAELRRSLEEQSSPAAVSHSSQEILVELC